ncbi:MAG: carboxypeptidase regulatory-like domain-containing protein [Bacteroidota bacterium]|nr:carboxypeptidase regulatory-like domain-containing protein [Bacteroidota bacterium]
MKSNLKILFGAAIFFFAALTSFGQGTTTSGMNGKVADTNGETLPGATVIAVHTPTGSQFGGITDTQGYFRLPNLNVGGPYKVTVSYVGFESYEKDGIYLTLGQTFKLNVTLGQTTTQLAEVAVTGTRVKEFNAFDGNRTGAETVVGADEIAVMPSINRDMTDFTRLTPQASVRDDGAITIAGINNRFNAISIDGAVNNDVFGLSATGTNGGQTGGSPISMDAIEQFQVVLAPFDVRQSGFAGASINAVTRSGSNKVEASAYYFMRNEGLAGKTPNEEDKDARDKLPKFSSNTYGIRIGAPIIKNKLFVFASAEIQREETPANYTTFDTGYEGDSDRATIGLVTDKLESMGYDPGPWESKTRTLDSDKFLIRLDWNINQHHKLMARHSYTNLEAVKVGSSSNYSIGYENNAQYFPSVTNSSSVELKSNYDGFSNNMIVGFTSVRDDRDPYGASFPALRIYDGSATIYAGSEPYSTANMLDQDVLTFTNNFSIYKGKHTITFGANIEYSSTYNLFMRKNFGEYRYSTVADFLTVGTAGEVPAYQYERGYSLTDDDVITGDGSEAAAIFSMLQWGLYAQDEFQVSDDFKVTLGVRIDMPMFLDDPAEDTHFNTVTKLVIENEWDMFGAQAGQMPKSQLMFSPRIGFNWDVNGNEETQVRGGLGIFTSRIPLVWPGGSYTNNGVTIGGVYHRSSWGTDIYFRPDWDNQYRAADFGGTDAEWGGQMDLFAEDFKFPQVFRVSAAVDQKLPVGGLIASVEGIYTKTLNNVLYYNMNVEKEPDFYLTGADKRPHYDNSDLDGDYTRIMVGTNTSEGYTYNITASIQKPLTKGFSGTLAYTFGRAMALNDATSSQNSSQWRYMEQVNGLNNLELSYSDFDLGHRIVAFANYRIEYLNHLATTFSLYYNGQSGRRFSYVYADYGDLNGNGESDNNLIWIPADASEIVFEDGDPTGQQWTDLDEFIKGDDYLSQHRGDYAERNGARNPFTHIFDFKIVQDIFVDAGPGKHTLQVSFDIFNLGNMLNNTWGLKYYTGNDNFRLIDFEGFGADTTTPEFSFDKPSGDVWTLDDSGISSSRWQAQLGIRYIF